MASNILKYKDFFGSVEYSADDECFYGKIIGTSDLVTFEGDSVESLKKAFFEAVEDYLVLCNEVGKQPQKTYGMMKSKSILLWPILIALLLLAAACGGQYTSDTDTYEPVFVCDAPLIAYPPTTHERRYLTPEITLHNPVIWSAWYGDDKILIYPWGRSPCNYIYERTAFEIRWSPISESTWPCTVLLQHDQGTFETTVGNVTAIGWPTQYDNPHVWPFYRRQRYRVIWNGKVFDIILQNDDGCFFEWAILEEIRDSLYFHGDNSAFDWQAHYDVLESCTTRQDGLDELIGGAGRLAGVFWSGSISIEPPPHWTIENSCRAQGIALEMFNPETDRSLAFYTRAELIIEWDLGPLPTAQELLYWGGSQR